MSNIDDAMKTDIALMKGDMSITPGGDLATVRGLANLKLALFHRLMTVPGSLAHRPNYGVGITQYQNAASSFSVQQKLATLIGEQFGLDPRIERINRVAITSDDSTPERTVIVVSVTPIGYSELEMQFTPFSEVF